MTIDEILEHDERFRYMMLDRMRSDCEYFLGNGNRYSKCLWTGNVTEQIEAMKAIYESFPDDKKPEWISLEEIERYAYKMAYQRRTSYEVEYEIDQIEEEVRREYGLPDNWYGDVYGSLLEDPYYYGTNLRIAMEMAKSVEEYEEALQLIRRNFEVAAASYQEEEEEDEI